MKGRTYAAVIAATLVGLSLTGCTVNVGGPAATHSSAAPSSAAPTSEAPSLTPTQTFVSDVRAGSSLDESVSDKQIIQLGEAMCAAHGKGYGESDVEKVADGTGFDTSDVQVVWDASLRDLCPNDGI